MLKISWWTSSVMYKEHTNPRTHTNPPNLLHMLKYLGGHHYNSGQVHEVIWSLQITRHGFTCSTRFPGRRVLPLLKDSSSRVPAGWARGRTCPATEHLQGWAEQGGEVGGLGRGKPEMCPHLQGAAPQKRLCPSPPNTQTWLVQSDTDALPD